MFVIKRTGSQQVVFTFPFTKPNGRNSDINILRGFLKKSLIFHENIVLSIGMQKDSLHKLQCQGTICTFKHFIIITECLVFIVHTITTFCSAAD